MKKVKSFKVKKLVLFAVFSVSILLLMPMVNSVETRMVKDQIEDKIDDFFLKIGLIIDLLKNIYGIFTIKDIIKIIFLILLSPIFYLIFYISMWGDWSYFNIIEFIELYFLFLSAILYVILELFSPNLSF
jgi:hypothetical protein